MKKYLKIVFVILLFIICTSKAIFADDEIYTEGNLQFTINDNNTIEIAYYYGKDTALTIPWTIGDYQIEDFRDGAFSNSDVTSIRVPDYLYDYNTKTSKINIRSFNPGTTIIFYDAFGNETVNYDTSINNVVNEEEEPEYEEYDPNTSTIEDNNSRFEDQDVLLGDDVFKNSNQQNQNSIIEVAKRIRDAFLYNGAQFASNFSRNPIGYIIIIASIIGLVYIFMRFIKIRRR